VAKKASSKKKATPKASKAASAPKASTKKKIKKSAPAKTAAKKPAKKAAGKAAGRSASGASRKASGRKSTRKTPLTKGELRTFRDLLLEKRRDLVGDMNGMEAEALRVNRQDGTGDLSNMPTHPADIGSDNYEQEFTLGLLQSERTMLVEIDEALARIADGTYGLCLGTGEPIGKARLTARPWAKYCIEYARMVEKGLVREGDTVNLDDDEDNEDEDDEDFDSDLEDDEPLVEDDDEVVDDED